MHKLLEQYYKGTLTKEEMQVKYLLDFSTEVRGERPPGSTSGKYVLLGSEYLRNFSPLPYKTVCVEQKFDFNINGIPFVAVVDYVGEDDGLIVVDNKSRDLSKRSNRAKPTKNDATLDAMLRQLYIYSCGIKSKYGEFPKKLCFNCFKAGVFIEEPFSMSAYNESVEWAEKGVNDVKRADEFPPAVDYFGCKFICGVSDECCYWQMR